MSAIRMKQTKRGCGDRVLGGLYAFFEISSVDRCPNLPLRLPELCSVCGEGVHQARGIRYITPSKFLPRVKTKCKRGEGCPICNPTTNVSGLLWVGNQYYTPTQFIQEAQSMGISKRIATKPEKLKVGDWVYFVHPHVIRIGNAVFDEAEAPAHVKHSQTKPGIFLTAQLTAYHKIITEEQAEDKALVQELENNGITPVVELPQELFAKLHVLITDDMARDLKSKLTGRATCPVCDGLYGYTGDNPKYCPKHLKERKRREEKAKDNPEPKKKVKKNGS